MRKKYIHPLIKQRCFKTSPLLAASGVTGDVGIGYGGKDEEGTMEPSAKPYTSNSIWEDE